jgi:hypothetical protein
LHASVGDKIVIEAHHLLGPIAARVKTDHSGGCTTDACHY